MKFRAIGQSDVAVSVIGFGVWTVATKWWGITDRALGIQLARVNDLYARKFHLGATIAQGA